MFDGLGVLVVILCVFILYGKHSSKKSLSRSVWKKNVCMPGNGTPSPVLTNIGCV